MGLSPWLIISKFHKRTKDLKNSMIYQTMTTFRVPESLPFNSVQGAKMYSIQQYDVIEWCNTKNNRIEFEWRNH